MKIKPGQFCTINSTVFRAKRRIDGCKGCALDDILSCPNIVDHRNGTPLLDCSLLDIILIRV